MAPSSCRAHKNRGRAAGRGPAWFVRVSLPVPGGPQPGRRGLPAAARGQTPGGGGRGAYEGGRSRAAPNNPLRISEGEKHLREVEGIRQIRPSPSQISRNGPRVARSTRLDISHQRASCAGWRDALVGYVSVSALLT